MGAHSTRSILFASAKSGGWLLKGLPEIIHYPSQSRYQTQTLEQKVAYTKETVRSRDAQGSNHRYEQQALGTWVAQWWWR